MIQVSSFCCRHRRSADRGNVVADDDSMGVRDMGQRGHLQRGVVDVEPSNGLKRAMALEVQRALAGATRAATTDPITKILLAAGGSPALEEFRSAVDGENATVLLATDGAEALARWWAEDPDLLVVDAALPTFDGFDLCRAIRGSSETPIVIVASASGDELVVRGLDCGADDVVSPPLQTAVFRLRLRAVINRYRAAKLDRSARAQLAAEPAAALTIGNLTLDAESRVVSDGAVAVQLTLREYRILELLALNPGLTISFRRLFEHAWGTPGDGPLQRVTLRRYVMRIRKRLRPLGNGGLVISSKRGLGYAISKK
jgi:DNA-binding response OmpR family regulator